MTSPADERPGILYHRTLPYGPAVRIRRTSPPGAAEVTAVLEVDRRYGTTREREGGEPPPLMTARGASEAAVLAELESHARDDATVVRLMRERGVR